MALTAPPTPPSRSDSPSLFSSRADALMAWLPTMTTELDALQTATQTYADAASSLANMRGLWSNLTGALNVPASVIHNDLIYVLNTSVADVTLETPGVSSKWTLYVRKETVYAVSGTAPALNPANGTMQTWTLSANSTPTDGLVAGQSMTLMIDDGSSYTITWPTMSWVGGSAPTLATSGYTIVVLWKVGSTLYGAHVGNA